MRTAPTSPSGPERRRVIVEPGGPVLVEGPVEIVMADGATVVCDRFMVALCTCRRSRTMPLCDTSHRRTRRAG
ncbi:MULTISPECIES: CDGSH iron-sulfur domain-containing protein [Thermomonospora]|uniref:Zinc finger CDGSH-type domain protein n=1 Tax=Thermomonospora curvata (strain ATCC 19995 / DSM 43183 / JCM 3096 / KCTC 9072 / NBRC 15933 / NCIMB 10081 / Henssen B9) TaxID=471852 RepID=D1A3W0_THECD|nr:zinc finger CDGSH-type domain protein [Thermomonospora curvata DSM 43183]PKK14290.1 MAG: CDGSH iron-sulfur domain-containing protein [Thermomonospora sp. CIF 1]